MLHTFFFVLSFVMDYNAADDALRSGFLLGLTDSCLVCVAVVWLRIRSGIAAENRGMPFRSQVN
jgi:hypothetical protein